MGGPANAGLLVVGGEAGEEEGAEEEEGEGDRAAEGGAISFDVLRSRWPAAPARGFLGAQRHHQRASARRG